ncbi:calcium/calmodulin-dependent 3',5'-cyclic nucleotide phosphodiesterase 1C-like [Scyliorhinus canicula]|uniref:calcium/calmodulin-dependent 3',5'-cyclic nucleotide phosphodiesterase 1C-like n=1 Tax=Scyliorhinus canicula TaxID=7830 RepID=UPI0018F69EAC|nr:calcium/calmodulin-dependent 3',5'-cyclic nucleotide phosphodiesterase 1C-like [Scyliorhinus canicula]
MTEPSSRKQGFKKCRSATFNIDGFSFTIRANEKTDRNPRPLERFARSKSQTTLRHTGARHEGKKEKRKEKKGIDIDLENPEEILAEEFLSVDNPDALDKHFMSKEMFEEPLVLGSKYFESDAAYGFCKNLTKMKLHGY